jgi:hypothetical protein
MDPSVCYTLYIYIYIYIYTHTKSGSTARGRTFASELMFSHRRLCRVRTSGLCCRVVRRWQPDVSDERKKSIFRIEKWANQGTENGSNTFLRNIGLFPNYTVLQNGRPYSSAECFFTSWRWLNWSSSSRLNILTSFITVFARVQLLIIGVAFNLLRARIAQKL